MEGRDNDHSIVVEGLAKSYGSVQALCGVDFAARTGTVLGLLGPNGAGKTTAVRILATLLRPDAGRAVVAGLDVVERAAELRAKIGLAGQYAAVDESLRSFENLETGGRLYHLPRKGAGVEATRHPRASVGAKVRAEELVEGWDLVEAAKAAVEARRAGMLKAPGV